MSTSDAHYRQVFRESKHAKTLVFMNKTRHARVKNSSYWGDSVLDVRPARRGADNVAECFITINHHVGLGVFKERKVSVGLFNWHEIKAHFEILAEWHEMPEQQPEPEPKPTLWQNIKRKLKL